MALRGKGGHAANASVQIANRLRRGMNVSAFDLFKLGIGPSSSHTMGPMTAAVRFLAWLGSRVEQTARVEVTLYASLALTGRGHATDRAVILGLAGFEPPLAGGATVYPCPAKPNAPARDELCVCVLGSAPNSNIGGCGD